MTIHRWITATPLAIVLLLFTACAASQKQPVENKQEMETFKLGQPTKGELPTATVKPAVASPVVYLYKTRGDYAHRVPVLMDAAKQQIVSYPHPKDLWQGDKLRLPTPMQDGYLLDNKGISPQVAFLTYTYEEYSLLPEAPSMEQLMANILDKNPLIELHECGRRADYKELVPELNAKIKAGFPKKVLSLPVRKQ